MTALLQRIDELTARVTQLERQGGRTSRNSSQAPSQDGLQKQTKSLREKSDRPVGGQAGHRGATLRLRTDPDQSKTHRHTHGTGCGAALPPPADEAPDARRQVFELPVLQFTVTEQRAAPQACGPCQRRVAAAFPAHVTNVCQ